MPNLISVEMLQGAKEQLNANNVPKPDVKYHREMTQILSQLPFKYRVNLNA